LDVNGDGAGVAEAHLVLDPSLVSRLRAQAKNVGTSAATLMHAAWALVVSCTTGKQEVTYGTVLLGRTDSYESDALGMFVNVLPIVFRLEVTALELVEAARKELLDLIDHQNASLAIAQRCSGISPRVPLFTSILNYRHGGADFDTQIGDAAGLRILA